MQNDIYFYNFHWKDYTSGDTSALLDMVKVVSFAATEGKVSFVSSFPAFEPSFDASSVLSLWRNLRAVYYDTLRADSCNYSKYL